MNVLVCRTSGTRCGSCGNMMQLLRHVLRNGKEEGLSSKQGCLALLTDYCIYNFTSTYIPMAVTVPKPSR
jgi:hypothetical protein